MNSFMKMVKIPGALNVPCSTGRICLSTNHTNIFPLKIRWIRTTCTGAILHVHGTGPDGSNLHIFVNHWKSRSGGEQETERQRMFSAITLRKQLDMLLARESDFKVIIMGDFNDEPTNRSISQGSIGPEQASKYPDGGALQPLL